MKPFIHVSNDLVMIDTDYYKLTLAMKQQPAVTEHNDIIVTRRMAKETHKAGGAASKINHHIADTTEMITAPARTVIKECPKCSSEFEPRGNAQKYCSEACGMKTKRYTKKKKLTPEQEAELERTLAEVEQRQKQPYAFVEQL